MWKYTIFQTLLIGAYYVLEISGYFKPPLFFSFKIWWITHYKQAHDWVVFSSFFITLMVLKPLGFFWKYFLCTQTWKWLLIATSMIVAASVSTQTSIHSFFQPLQVLNHTPPITLDKMNYIFWHSPMENVIYANRFVDFVEGQVMPF